MASPRPKRSQPPKAAKPREKAKLEHSGSGAASALAQLHSRQSELAKLELPAESPEKDAPAP